MNEEVAELDRQTHKEAQDDHDDEAVGYFGTVILSNHAAKVECEVEDVLSCYKEIVQAKMGAGTKQVCKMQTIQAGLRASGRSFQFSARARAHTM
jgi:hypothetical protein